MSEHVVVVGAGVFGSWTATHLLRAGHRVTLVDAFGPAHSRASSGGESRLIRGAYGKDAIYTRMAMDSLPEWKDLSAQSGLPIFHRCGILFFFAAEEPYLKDTIATHREAGLPTEVLDQDELSRRFPAFDFSDIQIGIFEAGFGVLMARRAVQTLVDRFVRAGGTFSQGQAQPPSATGRLDELRLASGESIQVDRFVFAAGPWLPKLFPDVIGPRIRATRQELFYFAPPAGDRAYSLETMPGWAEFSHGEMYYGMPDLEGRGVKIAHDIHGPEIDPDTHDRRASDAALAKAVAFRDRRLPGLRGSPPTGAEVCQYENSSNGDFLIDFHPQWDNVLLVGGGSGHGFKHGPEVGRYAAQRLFGLNSPEPRFGLATKATSHQREVH
jgi:sarcosine oxidase